ncbi:MAG TPA: winged helix-turn-helix domain-containing protein [Polyangia bacterium]|nr:winged helix-turn-helix domain-containing protein [Polyangia bacterium]
MITALRRLGGSATIPELYEAVVDAMKLTEEQLSVLHDAERGEQTEAAYRMAWARTYLKKAGFLTNSERGVWALTPAGREEEPDPERFLNKFAASTPRGALLPKSSQLAGPRQLG